ncbi:MAG: cation transporter [Oscillospiraceae bacterium]|nr:cation transporter [Oscillospiraceae bacterium]
MIGITIVAIVINIILAVLKIAGGYISHTHSLIADGVDSASDSISSIISAIGIKESSKSADLEHAYGHEKMESIATIILSFFMLYSGFSIGWNNVKSIIFRDHEDTVTTLGMWICVAALAAKFLLFIFTKMYAVKLNSLILRANSLNYRNDCFTEIAVLISIISKLLGFEWLDYIVAFVIALLIIKSGAEILTSSINGLSDRSCDTETESKIYNVIMEVDGVEVVDLLKTRLFGSKVYVDTEIRVHRELTLIEAHNIAEEVHEQVEKNFPDVKHIMVHVNPD